MTCQISDLALGVLDKGSGIRLYPIEFLDRLNPVDKFTDQCYFVVRGEDGIDRKASVKQLKEFLNGKN